jgi:probable F420-dependent oxidoreductase
MQLGLFPQTDLVPGKGPTLRFRELQAVAQAAEEMGFDSLWIADHLLLRYPQEAEQGCCEAFTFLSGLAALTSRIQLGSLVACTSFRSPALLAKMAESLDEISAGRFILGLGAGWHEPEFAAFGFPFDHLTTRFEEALQIITPLLHEGSVNFEGKYYQARHAALLPRSPSPSGPPIWIGARGLRMLELTARYAHAWNMASWSFAPDRIAQECLRLVEVCERVGRDPATLDLTANVMVHLSSPGQQVTADDDEITGAPEEVAEALRGFAEVGIKHLVISVPPGGVAGIEQFGRVIELLDEG